MIDQLSDNSKDLINDYVKGMIKEHIILMVGEYIGVPLTDSGLSRLQSDLDSLVQVWVEHGMVHNTFYLSPNLEGDPPTLPAVEGTAFTLNADKPFVVILKGTPSKEVGLPQDEGISPTAEGLKWLETMAAKAMEEYHAG
ncbi:hypothetical protein [Microcoleus phage My-WqHQDG]|nr:hypothetical protein [Microcoleus phage My-WqHQDG]